MNSSFAPFGPRTRNSLIISCPKTVLSKTANKQTVMAVSPTVRMMRLDILFSLRSNNVRISLKPRDVGSSNDWIVGKSDEMAHGRIFGGWRLPSPLAKTIMRILTRQLEMLLCPSSDPGPRTTRDRREGTHM